MSDTLSLQYTFDDQGNISGIDEDGLKQSFFYEHGRLALADMVTGEYAYSYDDVGNRVASYEVKKGAEPTENEYTYSEDGNGNRLLSAKDVVSGFVQEYEYNEVGAPLKAGDEYTYTYNVKQRPIEVYKAGELVAEYRYNTFGERVQKTVHTQGVAESTYYLYDGHTLAAEIDNNGRVTSQYLYLQDHYPVVKFEGKEVFAIHTDQLGTPRKLTDDNAELVWDASYTPFGQADVTLAKVEMNLRFPGQYEDSETGTHYNYFRDYDPSTGRYLTSDPIGLNGGINTYAYANNSPIALFDKTGLAPAAEPLDGPLSPGGWTITAEQYNELAALANANRRVEYYFMLHNLTGSRLAFEMSQISSNSEVTGGVAWNANYAILEAYPDLYPQDANGESDIQTFSELIFQADFDAVEQYACGVDGPIYRIPTDTDMIAVTMGVWESVGLGNVAPPLIREMLDEYGDIYAQSVVGGSMSIDKLIELGFGEGSGDAIAEYLGQTLVPERYDDAIPFIIQATDEEMSEANGFYEPEFIRDHPGDVIETTFSADCFSKIMRAPISSRDPNMSADQEILYNDVSGAPEHDVIVVLTSGPEYMTCTANR